MYYTLDFSGTLKKDSSGKVDNRFALISRARRFAPISTFLASSRVFCRLTLQIVELCNELPHLTKTKKYAIGKASHPVHASNICRWVARFILDALPKLDSHRQTRTKKATCRPFFRLSLAGYRTHILLPVLHCWKCSKFLNSGRSCTNSSTFTWHL